MISVLVYIIKLLLNFFVTTILVTDVTSEQKDDSKNLKLIIFVFFYPNFNFCSSIFVIR